MKTNKAIQAQKFTQSFNSPEHDLRFDVGTNCIIINGVTYVPLAHVNEFTILPSISQCVEDARVKILTGDNITDVKPLTAKHKVK